MASCSHHGSVLRQNPTNQANCDLISNLCTTSLHLMKPTKQTCSTTYHDQNLGTWPPTAAARAITREQRLLELSHAPPQILDSQLRSQSHALPRRPCRPPIYLAWESGGHTKLHASPGFLASPSRANEHRMLLPRAETLLLMSSDVITPCQQPRKHVHISKSHVSPRHVIRHIS